MIDPDQFFDPIPKQKEIAKGLYSIVQNLPILSPHSHVDPAIFTGQHSGFGNPAEVLVQPDHYILRLLYSQGIPFEQLLDRNNPRKVWHTFAENYSIFRGNTQWNLVQFGFRNCFQSRRKTRWRILLIEFTIKSRLV